MATNTAKVIGKLGQALKFDGVDDYVSVPDHSSFNTSGNFTTSVWFIAPNINQTAPLVGRRLGVAPYTQWNMIINGDDCLNGSLGKKICFFMAESYPTTYRSFRTTNEVVDGKWHNVVMVSNRTAGTFKAYVDGVEVSVTTELSSGSYPNPDIAQPFMMGNINSPLYLNGTIDDVRYYNRPLSASEVKQLYNQGASRIVSQTTNIGGDTLKRGLLGYWTFDGADFVNNIQDKSGAGNTGYMINMATSSAKVVGKIGQAINFDGVDDYVTTSDINSMDSLSTYTISVWAKPKTVTTNKEIVAKWSSLGMFVQSGTSVAGRVAFGFNGSNFVSTTNSVLSAGNWIHIVGTFDNSLGTGKHKIYINGVSQAFTNK
jgi:hypothetical protein